MVIRLDKTRPYATVISNGPLKYLQDGFEYNGQGIRVEPDIPIPVASVIEVPEKVGIVEAAVQSLTKNFGKKRKWRG